MQLFPDEPDFIPGTKGFADVDAASQPHDLLQRAETGKQLSDLLERIAQPLVVALDGEWGSGKSHFLKLWTGAHGRENGGKARVVYFDAFEHDFLDDPLIGLVGAIAATHEPTGRIASGVKKLKEFGAILARPLSRVAVAVATGGASELAAAALDPIVAATGAELSALAEDFWKKEDGRRAAMVEFRRALSALTSGPDGEQKLIIVVDELDRCRPDFALNLLEVIKHFFSVPNVHFVLGVNLDALAHSVRARYGQGCDAGLYLQKFVHLTMRLPRFLTTGVGAHVAVAYLTYIARTGGLDNKTQSELEKHIEQIVLTREISLRDIERIVANLLLVPKLKEMQGTLQSLIITAILLRVLDPLLYRELREQTLRKDKLDEFYGMQIENRNRSFIFDFLSELWDLILRPSLEDSDIKRIRDFLPGCRFGTPREYIEGVFRYHLDTFTLTP